MNLNKLLLFITTLAISLQIHATTIEMNGYYRSTNGDFYGHGIVGKLYGGNSEGIGAFLRGNDDYTRSLRDSGWGLATRTQITEIYSSFGLELNEIILNGRGVVNAGLGYPENLSITNQPKKYVDFIRFFGDTHMEGDLEIGTYLLFSDNGFSGWLNVLIEEYYEDSSERIYSSSKSSLIIRTGGPIETSAANVGPDYKILLTKNYSSLPEPSTLILILSGIFAISIRKIKFRKLVD